MISDNTHHKVSLIFLLFIHVHCDILDSNVFTYPW